MEAQTRRTTGDDRSDREQDVRMFDFVGSNFNGFFNSGFTALEVAEGKAGQRNHNDADQTHGDGWS